ncbi:unnamed protein product [Sympodiomycopsis kandeliae]
MSRSLRTRPLTLYDSNPPSAIPPVSSTSTDDQYYARQQHHQQQQQPTSASSSKGSGAKARLKKASNVGSNLKKRLSTRYGDNDQDSGPGSRGSRGSRFFQQSIPAVPSLPKSASQTLQHEYNIEEDIEGEEEDQILPDGRHHDQYQQHDEQHHQQQYHQHHHQHQHQVPQSGLVPGQTIGIGGEQYITPPAVSARSTGSRLLQAPPGSAAAQTSAVSTPASSSSSSRKPTLAWQGSALARVIHDTQRQGLDQVIHLDSLRKQQEFDGTEYLRLHMTDGVSSEEFTSTLGQVKVALQKDVKSQAFDHYADFIAISSQVGALENEVIELKSLLSEWRAIPRLLEREDESGRSSSAAASAVSGILGGSSSGLAGNRRNSLLSLQQVYRAQLTSLWEGISNSQKFIPYKPGRHLIAEASDFVELNSATYRPTKNVALFLLDDLLLVAARKKATMSTKVRFEAERCFALGDIVVVDLKDGTNKDPKSSVGESSSSAIRDSIKIKRGKETFIYRAERPESKKALLNSFRRVAEDLANKRKKQGSAGGSLDDPGNGSLSLPASANRRQSVYSGMQVDQHQQASSKSSLRSMREEPEDEDGNESDGETQGVMKLATQRIKEERRDPHRWMNDWSDTLAVDIALRRWSEATDKVLKGKGVLSTYTPLDPIYELLSTHLKKHTSSLVSALLQSIQSGTLRKQSLINLSSHLTQLGYSSVARQVFLQSRTELLSRRKRNIKFEGDVELYISELSMVVFGMIRNTSEWFMASWKEISMASNFVQWALKELHSFAINFKRQAHSHNQNSDLEMINRCTHVALQSAKQLKDVGLDFEFVLLELLQQPQSQPSKSSSTLSSVATDRKGLSSRIAAFETGAETKPLSIERKPRPAAQQQQQQQVVIPSLTLTLADEASGISHRISSADLPAVTAQEIRRKSQYHHHQ